MVLRQVPSVDDRQVTITLVASDPTLPFVRAVRALMTVWASSVVVPVGHQAMVRHLAGSFGHT
eukprot:10415562-Prorocentrum_lima.AAC.1